MTIMLPPKLRERQLFQIAVRKAEWQGILNSRREAEKIAKEEAGRRNTDEDPPSQRPHRMACLYDVDIPLTGSDDLAFGRGKPVFIVGQEPEYFADFESACRGGPLSTVQSVISEPRSPVFLHYGLTLALRAGNLETAGALIDAGAPIIGLTPTHIVQAPPEKQLPLFVLLARHGWDTNTSTGGTRTMLASVVNNIPVLQWFLVHGANPNLGDTRPLCPGPKPPATESYAALHAAVCTRNLEAVRMLLDAGAEIRYGTPLHLAAGMPPPGMNSGMVYPYPGKEIDESMIPIMALLLERGADVNKKKVSGRSEPRFAIVCAAKAGMVQRVRWLLEHGANPEISSTYGSAVELARKRSNEELKKVVEEGVAARRWIKDAISTIELP